MTEITNSYVLDVVKASLANILTKNPLYNHFMIGKTIQNLSERFGQNYEGEYDDIALLYDGGPNGALVDWLEEEMIRYCWEVYGKDECDNEQVGGGPTCEDNVDKDSTAKLYVVWKER